jgi:acyl-CoA synthetase (AMP-forming)/AMP-acid ligase II
MDRKCRPWRRQPWAKLNCDRTHCSPVTGATPTRAPRHSTTAGFGPGDLGRLDPEGYLYVVDRLKDMIITGGENVYSAEVEQAIYTFPGVAQAAVIGIPSQAWGEEVHTVIVPQPGAVLDRAALMLHLRDCLAGYKCPKSIDIRQEPLPIAGTNKVNKRALRETYSTTSYSGGSGSPTPGGGSSTPS